MDLGPGRTAVAITGGGYHTCAILDNGRVRCWGYGVYGQLGYGNTRNIGDNETPGSVGPVDLGRDERRWRSRAAATTPARSSTTARCAAGVGGSGQLGYGNRKDIGDNETPASVRP